jgi:hypothetical protein
MTNHVGIRVPVELLLSMTSISELKIYTVIHLLSLIINVRFKLIEQTGLELSRISGEMRFVFIYFPPSHASMKMVVLPLEIGVIQYSIG